MVLSVRRFNDDLEQLLRSAKALGLVLTADRIRKLMDDCWPEIEVAMKSQRLPYEIVRGSKTIVGVDFIPSHAVPPDELLVASKLDNPQQSFDVVKAVGLGPEEKDPDT